MTTLTYSMLGDVLGDVGDYVDLLNAVAERENGLSPSVPGLAPGATAAFHPAARAGFETQPVEECSHLQGHVLDYVDQLDALASSQLPGHLLTRFTNCVTSDRSWSPVP